jgi:hypothetical protein
MLLLLLLLCCCCCCCRATSVVACIPAYVSAAGDVVSGTECLLCWHTALWLFFVVAPPAVAPPAVRFFFPRSVASLAVASSHMGDCCADARAGLCLAAPLRSLA